jgi:hypothetical protein
MKSRIIKAFVRFILALIIAPVILLGWIMICLGEKKEPLETTNALDDMQFYVYPDIDTIEIEENND